MALTIKDVEKVATLARLELTEKDKEKFSNQLANILSYIEKLNGVNTDNISEFISKGADKNVMREDIEKNLTSNAEIMMNAPDREGNFFKVKKVIE